MTKESGIYLQAMIERIGKIQKQKPVMAEANTFLSVLQMLRAEVDEAIEAVENDVSGDPMPILSELADLGYLWLYLVFMSEVNAEQLLEWKVLRNAEKYPPDRLQNGDLSSIMSVLRAEWALKGGDVAWSHRYLDEENKTD